MQNATLLWGGINSASHALKLIKLGVEKVAVSSAAIRDVKIISEMADAVGSQSVEVLDVINSSGF